MLQLIKYKFHYQDIYEFKNLYLAYEKSSCRKRHKTATITYAKNLAQNIEKLQNQLIREDVSVGKYTYFTVTDPKLRNICAASFDTCVS